MSIALATTKLPDAYIGVPYEASFAYSGGQAAASITVSAGGTQTNKVALPTGLAYTATGRITGTPTTANVPGVKLLSIKTTDGTNVFDNNAFTLNLFDASQLPTHDTEIPIEEVEAADLDAEWPVVQ